jgi:hypothetical protein
LKQASAQSLPERISPEELAAKLAGLTEHQKAVYYFFSGDDASAIRLLHAKNEDDLDAESLFLLSVVYAETGQNDQANHLEQKLDEEFPDGVFANFTRPSAGILK